MLDNRVKSNNILHLNIKYALFHATFLGASCAIFNYASVYLLSKGVSNATIGIVLALVSSISIFAQPAISAFADRNKKIKLQTLLIIIGVLACLCGVALYFLNFSISLILCLYVGAGTCMYTMVPLMNSLAFIFKKYGIELNFSIARCVGSATSALTNFALGFLVNDFGTEILPLVYLLFNIFLIVVVKRIDVKEDNQEIDLESDIDGCNQLSLLEFCAKYKKFMLFIIGAILVYSTHMLINNFMIQIITPIGGNEKSMGIALSLGIALELPVMLGFNFFKNKFGCISLLRFSSIIFIIKHALLWLAPNMIFVYLSQTLQMISYPLFNIGAVYYANTVINKNDLVKGQSMIAISSTACSIIASLSGGFLMDALSVSSVLFIGVIISILGSLIVFISTKHNLITK